MLLFPANQRRTPHIIGPASARRSLAARTGATTQSRQIFARRLIRNELPTTVTLETAIAPAAIIGLSQPNAASGMAATL